MWIDDGGMISIVKGGYTPAYKASQYGHLDVLKFLVEAKANVNKWDEVWSRA